ncbi:hypothetical protein CDAR_616351 [Caerostris darwini]|uniref:Uncharacterized protein n=1 Tax=Caerostris darwini TaxID=1538125 RepID=A0AAV4SHE7_9ARAC|nr:hypothetical protein CDAR_616351 [Caerostris darwini]
MFKANRGLATPALDPEHHDRLRLVQVAEWFNIVIQSKSDHCILLCGSTQFPDQPVPVHFNSDCMIEFKTLATLIRLHHY